MPRMWRKQRPLFPVILAHIAITVIITIIAVGLNHYKENIKLQNIAAQGSSPNIHSRDLLEVTSPESVLKCIPRSIEEFPEDFFTLEEKQSGGVFVHIVIALYLFAALAVICDDYFVSSIERICEVTHMKPDVAGATLMAGGSSAPELFTALIGVFITKSDVGVSTIVGSAVFNILCIIAICAIFAKGIIVLSWWPLLRDTSFYCVTVIVLIVTVYDSEVHWYEGLVYLLMYILYIVIMYFNEKLEGFFLRYFPQQRKPIIFGDLRTLVTSPNEDTHLLGSSDAENSILISGRNTDDEEAAKELEETIDDEEEYVSPFKIPDNFFVRVYWVAMFPMRVLFMLTCPDCRRPGTWKNLYAITFVTSVLWIGILAYVLVWMVCSTGDALGIPDTIMGLTLLAAGTSIPDALAGVIVARNGQGDMAVSNSIGSNVFDILVCLGIPWLIQGAIITPGLPVPINSAGIIFTSISLLASVVFLISSLAISKWRLTKLLGLVFLIVYIAFMTFSCLYEVNVFGEVNPPSCPRTRF